jgi:hypothetical protein
MASKEEKQSNLKGVYLVNCAEGMNVKLTLGKFPNSI